MAVVKRYRLDPIIALLALSTLTHAESRRLCEWEDNFVIIYTEACSIANRVVCVCVQGVRADRLMWVFDISKGKQRKCSHKVLFYWICLIVVAAYKAPSQSHTHTRPVSLPAQTNEGENNSELCSPSTALMLHRLGILCTVKSIFKLAPIKPNKERW